MNKARGIVGGLGEMMVNGGQVLQFIAAPRTKVKEMPISVTPLTDDECTILVGTTAFLNNNFGRTGLVGTKMIIHFGSPLKKVKDRYSLQGVSMLISHYTLPGKKSPTVKIEDDIVISNRCIPEDRPDVLQFNMMDCILQSDGRLAIMGIPNVSMAIPSFIAPEPSRAW